jgi:hypothetical protein
LVRIAIFFFDKDTIRPETTAQKLESKAKFSIQMQLSLSVRNMVAFFLFGVLMGEAHEISHFLVGKIVCGCWPASRDFNAWSICDSCKQLGQPWYWATAMGPVFSMGLAWIGMFLLRSGNLSWNSLGFCLIWCNIPEARIATVLMGGGDEMVVIRELTRGTTLAADFRWISTLIVFAMALPPMIASFMAVKGKWGWLQNIAFMTLPLVMWGLYLHVLGNKLLFSGFLAEPWIMGTPLLITLHTILALGLFLIVRKELFTLVQDPIQRNVAEARQNV